MLGKATDITHIAQSAYEDLANLHISATTLSDSFNPHIDPVVWAIDFIDSHLNLPGIGSAVIPGVVPTQRSPSWLRFGLPAYQGTPHREIWFSQTDLSALHTATAPQFTDRSMTERQSLARTLVHELGHLRVAAQKDVTSKSCLPLGWFPAADPIDEEKAHCYAGFVGTICGAHYSRTTNSHATTPLDSYVAAPSPL